MLVDVAIVGGGPAGLSAAHALLVARPGLKVAVLERSDLRPRGATFALMPNGARALEAINPALKAALAPHSTPHAKTRRFSAEGVLLQASDDGGLTAKIEEHGDFLALPWYSLQRELADALPPGVLHTNHRFLSFSEAPCGASTTASDGSAGSTGGGVVAEFATPQGVRSVSARLLVGCDGGQSLVREQLLGDGPPEYLGRAIWRAVCPRPPDWVLDHGWSSWGGGQGKPVLLTLTLGSDRVCWQAFAPWPADQLHVIGGGRASYIQDPTGASDQSELCKQAAQQQGVQRLERALAAFQGFPAAIRDLIASTDPTAVTEHGQFCREADQCQTYARGCVALTGDAAHLATPFLGQGCSQALEDALELGRAVGEHGATPEALAAYQQARVPLASAVQAASVQLCKDFARGKVDRQEFDVNVEQGFVQRTFQPLTAA